MWETRSFKGWERTALISLNKKYESMVLSHKKDRWRRKDRVYPVGLKSD
jgi:hypothetical protein